MHHGKKSNDPHTPICFVEKLDWTTKTKRGIRLVDPAPDPCGSIKPIRIAAFDNHLHDLLGKFRDKFSLTGRQGHATRFAHQVNSASTARSND
ncbi:hypothetical protein PQR46_20485 [Paraburkholderia sediminicola]